MHARFGQLRSSTTGREYKKKERTRSIEMSKNFIRLFIIASIFGVQTVLSSEMMDHGDDDEYIIKTCTHYYITLLL